jgi:hypothetical protein
MTNNGVIRVSEKEPSFALYFLGDNYLSLFNIILNKINGIILHYIVAYVHSTVTTYDHIMVPYMLLYGIIYCYMSLYALIDRITPSNAK